MKKWIMNIIYIIVGITVGLAVVPALANTPLFTPAVTIDIISEQEAIDIAQNYTDEIFQLVSVKLDDDDDDAEYDIVLENDLKKVEVEINAVTGDVKDWDVNWKRSDLPNSVISLEEAKAIALAHAGEGFVVLNIELDDDDDDLEYKLILTSDSFKVEAEMDARDGTITKWEAKPLSSSDSSQNDDNDLVSQSSKQVSFNDSDSQTSGQESYNDSDSQTSGQVSFNDSDSQSSDSSSSAGNMAAVKTRSEVIAIARTRIGEGPVLIKISLDYDDGRPMYDLEFKSEDIEYEFEIDAITGDIVEFEIDD